MGAEVVPCDPTHGNGHSPFYEGNHGDDHSSHLAVKLLDLRGAMTYHHLWGNLVLLLEQLYLGRSVH